MRRVAFAMVLLAGCSGSSSECTATFTGNFNEQGSGARYCATLTAPSADAGWTVGMTLPAPTTPTTITVSIDLGATPSANSFNSDAPLGPWSASGTREPGCAYTAGPEAIPAGHYLLTFDTLDLKAKEAHGSLSLLTGLHALEASDCGGVDEETVQVTF